MVSLLQQLNIYQESWREAGYNGVLGVPPDWVPEYHKSKFLAHQRDCCKGVATGKYTLKQLQDSFNFMLTNCGWLVWMAVGDAEGPEHLKHLQPVSSSFRALAEMTELFRAVQLGESDGMVVLTDPGYSQRAQLGKKFSSGRKLGSGSPIRKAIAKHLSKAPSLKNPDLWEALKTKPPKGWEFFENSVGKYIEGPHMANMNYERFCNVCSEERKKFTG